MQYVLLVFQFAAISSELTLVLRLIYLRLIGSYSWFVALLITDACRNMYRVAEVLHWIKPHDAFWLFSAPLFWAIVAGATTETIQKVQAHVVPDPRALRVLPRLIPIGCILMVPMAILLAIYIEDPADVRPDIRAINAIIFLVAAMALVMQRFFLRFVRIRWSHNALSLQWAMILLLACEGVMRVATTMHRGWPATFLEAAAYKDVGLVVLWMAIKIRRKGEHALEPMTLVPEGMMAHAHHAGHGAYSGR